MRKTQRLLALLLMLALLAPCFGAALADDGDSGDEPTPDEVELSYDYGNATYYRVLRLDKEGKDKDELEESPERFYIDLMGNRQQQNYTSPDFDGIHYLYDDSMADLWTMIAGELIISQSDSPVDNEYSQLLYLSVLEQPHGMVIYGYDRGCSSTTVVAGSVDDAKNQLVTEFNGKGFNLTDFNPAFSYPAEGAAGAAGPVIASAVHLQKKDGSYRGAVVYFTDFKVVALLPDAAKGQNPYVKHIDSQPDPVSKVYASDVTNKTLTPVTASQTIENNWSASVTSTIKESKSYSLTLGVSIGTSVDFGFAGFSTNIDVSETEAVTNGWEKSESVKQSDSISRSVSVALPPYTSVLLKQQSGTATQSIKYNCPIGLTFTARIVGYKKDVSDTDMTRHFWTFGPDARADLYRRGILNRDLHVEVSSTYSEAVDWSKVGNIVYYHDRKREPMDFDPGTNPCGPYTPNIGDVMRAAKYVPFGKSKAEFMETLSSMNTDVMGVVPLEPLKVVSLEAPNVSFINDQPVSYGNFNYLHADMKVGDSSYTRLLTLSGKNQHGADYHGFNPLWGTWKVVDEKGKDLGDDGPVRTEPQDSGTTKYIAQKPGTCFLKYFIDEESYPKDVVAHAQNMDQLGADYKNNDDDYYIQNKDLDMTAALEITVTSANTIEVTGSFTGEVNTLGQSLENGGLAVSIRDESGKESSKYGYTWEARELPAKGINLNPDGTVSFTRAGTFHVRAVCDELKIASDWVEITAFDRTAATVTTRPKARSLTYNGEDQQLVTPGKAKGGAMVYWLDSDNNATLPDSAVFTDEIPEAKEVGDYTVWYMAQGDETHKDSEIGKVAVTIRQAPAGPVQPSPDALVYNGTAQALVVAGTAKGGTLQYRVGDSAWSEQIPTRTNAGEYTVWYRVKGDANHNDSDPASLKVTIEKKPLVVTPNDLQKTYGDADPALTWTADGLIGSDKLTGKPVRTKGEDVGTYAIRQGSLAASRNYELYFNEGVFTVEPKAVTVRAKNATAVYGEADPKLKYTVEGLVGQDRPVGSLSRKAGVNVGTYAIRKGSLALSSNYVMTFVGAKFTITPRPLTVRAENKEKAFGSADPALTWTADGLVKGDRLKGRLTRDPGEKPGKYAIRQGTLRASANYKLTYKAGKLVIRDKDPLPVKPDYTLLASMTTYKDDALRMQWTKVDGAHGYDVYFKDCDGDQDYQLTKSVRGRSCTFKNLKKGVPYKAWVQAWKQQGGGKVYIGEGSPVVHCIVGGSTEEFTNAKSVQLNKTKLTLVKGKKATLKATAKGEKSGLEPLKHDGAIRYYSSNANVAQVSSKGKVTAVDVGKCVIYAIASDGVRASAKVTVTAKP